MSQFFPYGFLHFSPYVRWICRHLQGQRHLCGLDVFVAGAHFQPTADRRWPPVFRPPPTDFNWLQVTSVSKGIEGLNLPKMQRNQSPD